MNPFIVLILAITSEVVGTTALKISDGMTRLPPTIVVIVAYGLAFWLLSMAIRTIPVGVAYAVWSGVGTIGITILGLVLFHQRLSAASYAGIAVIVAGTVILNLSLRTAH